jgi:ATP-binding cassette subfamily F protein uup
VEQVLTRLDLPEDACSPSLSGGMKRRVLLARALVPRPTCCCSTSRPTTSTSPRSPGWRIPARFGGSVVFVTHDRAFLRALATRIVEIDRGRVT